MKKYKYGELPTSGRWLKRSNIVYFVLAWNAFGFCFYHWWKKRKIQSDDDWSRMTSTQKYVSLMSKPEDEVTVMKIKGFSIEQKQHTLMSSYTKPADIPPPPSPPPPANLNSS